ncbi:MAG: acyl-CoA dehydrogenase family protein, partial [Halieaceae bacterium]|nr:acyl-CoA dehydrogenase family protein [Halieaceae bacterium]
MNFSFDEDQLAIQELARRIFADRVSDQFLLEFSRGEQIYDEPLWAILAEQGLLGLTVPDSAG